MAFTRKHNSIGTVWCGGMPAAHFKPRPSYALGNRGVAFGAALAVMLAGPVLLAGGNSAQAQPAEQPVESAAPGKKSIDQDLESILRLDIEQLSKIDVRTPAFNVEVTSVAKQESTVGRSAAAIYVITAEMIARSPATNVPDLLRMVPGLEVARIDAHSWAIACRGFSNRYTDKLLVLIDGRTVYTTMYGGVYWDVQDVMLQDVERIEVIRGPGGTLWGANAVNGVINIITKKAKHTQGALATYGGGWPEDLALGAARVGRSNGNGLHYRVYGKHFERGPGYSPDGEAHDDWRQGRAGFRADWEPCRDGSRLLTVQGDYYVGRNGVFGDAATPYSPFQRTFLEDEEVGGGNLLARWTRKFDDRSDWSLQMYFDRTQRAMSIYKQNVNTFDVEFQHRFPVELSRRHEIIWGADYRQVHDDEACDGFSVDFDPLKRTNGLFSMFVQDEIELVEDRFFFIVGSKFEHNDYSGFEYQPSGRVLYTPDRKHTWWGAVSRAVRTPARFEQNGFYTSTPVPLPDDPDFDRYFPRLQGLPSCTSDYMMSYELGYRAQPEKEYSYDVALFYNVYERQGSFAPQDPYVDPDGNLIVPLDFANDGRAHTYGVEVFGDWAISETWRVGASYSYLHVWIASVKSEGTFYQSGADPQNQVRLKSSWDLGRNWRLDADLRYVDSLPGLGVPSYITMDARLAWQPRKDLELGLIGRNLLDDHHLEFVEEPRIWFYGTEVRRSAYGYVTWRY